MAYQLRNGDVFLRAIEALPKGAARQEMEAPQILAYGEVTGHTHRIEGAVVERYDHDGRAYVLLHEAGVINHEEHGMAYLDPGVYELIIERDYDPSEYQRRVID